jgi:hypothetical protein
VLHRRIYHARLHRRNKGVFINGRSLHTIIPQYVIHKTAIWAVQSKETILEPTNGREYEKKREMNRPAY